MSAIGKGTRVAIVVALFTVTLISAVKDYGGLAAIFGTLFGTAFERLLDRKNWNGSARTGNDGRSR